ncbi:MAG TPA: GNAT family N-acetyltransferase [Solirubrobacteraceae bacterium]|nr:GNAT family N-acetyltransferase [Solirubrobacteraceae bacterium]
MLIRHADPEPDAPACLAIYTPFVVDSPVSFEDAPPSLHEFAARIERLNRTHAFLVAEDDGRIAGFAYAGPHRAREAYRWAVEATVYLHPDYHRQGLGRALYGPLFELLQRQGYRTVLAGIATPNPASHGLHRALGFEEVGVYRRIGWKAGAWRDVMWLAKQLGPDTDETQTPPSPGPPQRLAQPIEL